MSLLDDALKKRQQEMESPDIPSHLLGFQEEGEVEKSQPKKLFLTLLGILVIFTGGLSFALLKYSSSQIRPKVASINNTSQITHAPSQETKTTNTAPETKEKTKVLKKPAPLVVSDKNQISEVKANELKKAAIDKERTTPNHLKRTTKKQEIANNENDKHDKATKKHEVTHVSASPKKPRTISVSRIRKPNKTDAFFVTAARYQRDGRIKEAINIYKKILARYPKNRKARLNLAAAYLQIGQITPASVIMEKLYHEYPNDPRVLLNYAIVLTKFGKLKSALSCLSRAEAKGGPRFEILLNKGIVLRKMGRIREAIKAYQEASFLRPNDPRLSFNRAIVYDAAGSYSKAILYYKSFLDNPVHDKKKDSLVRERLQQLYAFLNNMRQQEQASNQD